MDVRLPDGTIVRGVPDGMSKEELGAKLKANGYNLDEPAAKPERSLAREAAHVAGNTVAGAVRGAGSIGATLLAPYDMASDALNGRGLSLQSNRERRAAMDSALGDMGAETDSTAYGLGKLGAEVAGTLGVGPAIGVAAKGTQIAKALPRIVEAIQTGGFSTGSRVVPTLAGRSADIGARMAGGAINGGASALAVNPEDAAMGTAVGAALPLGVKVVGSAGRVVGNALSSRMARGNAVNKIVNALGDGNVQQAVGDIQTYYPRGAEDIPVSAAAATGNPELARLEQGSRLRASPAWYEFDQRQGKAAFDNVNKATSEADELAQRAADRRANWQESWSKASENQKPRLWVRRMGQLGGDLEQAMASPEASNPAVRQVLEGIKNEVIRVGPSFSPGHLQQLRANLSGKVQPMSPDVFKSVPRDNPAVVSLIKEMDDILNTSTGGKWQKVIEGYAQDSEKLHQSKAAQKIRNSFVDAETGRIRGVSLDAGGDVPKITEAGLGRAMDAARLPDGSLALSQEAEARLGATLNSLRRQNIVQGVKRTATAGGGSDTIPNVIAAGAAHSAGAPNMLLQLIDGMKKIGTAKTDNQLAALLSNPDELAKYLDEYLAPRSPNRLAGFASRAAPVLAAGQ